MRELDYWNQRNLLEFKNNVLKVMSDHTSDLKDIAMDLIPLIVKYAFDGSQPAFSDALHKAEKELESLLSLVSFGSSTSHAYQSLIVKFLKSLPEKQATTEEIAKAVSLDEFSCYECLAKCQLCFSRINKELWRLREDYTTDWSEWEVIRLWQHN